MRKRTYRTAEAARLSPLFGFCIETLTDPVATDLAAIPEHEHQQALVDGQVPGLALPLSVYVAGLYAARDADWFEALALIQGALAMGFDPDQAQQVLGFIYRGLAAEPFMATGSVGKQ